jgi:hypothetical protein
LDSIAILNDVGISEGVGTLVAAEIEVGPTTGVSVVT